MPPMGRNFDHIDNNSCRLGTAVSTVGVLLPF